MTRTTKNDCRSAFQRLAWALGKDTSSRDIGSWHLDYNPHYGGYQVMEIVNDGGGVTLPLGELRLKPAAFYDACLMATRAVEIAKR